MHLCFLGQRFQGSQRLRGYGLLFSLLFDLTVTKPKFVQIFAESLLPTGAHLKGEKSGVNKPVLCLFLFQFAK